MRKIICHIKVWGRGIFSRFRKSCWHAVQSCVSISEQKPNHFCHLGKQYFSAYVINNVEVNNRRDLSNDTRLSFMFDI